MRIIAHIESDFSTKFGVPRQSGLIDELKSRVVFEPEYSNPDAFRGLEGFSHIWLIWKFSGAVREEWSPTVRPPRLGGNTRLGVFATRSPFRPNPVAISAVRLEKIELTTPRGAVLHIAGADLMNGTPIYDVKPYLPYADCIPGASGGFAQETARETLEVNFPPELLSKVPEDKRAALTQVLARDPRPAYKSSGERVYGMEFAGLEIHFTVSDGTARVVSVENAIQTGAN